MNSNPTTEPTNQTATEPKPEPRPKRTSIELAGKTINLRLTRKQLKNAKSRHGVDLAIIDMNNPTASGLFLLLSDPVYFIDCFWAFYEDQLKEKGFTEESFDEAIHDDNIDEVREAFMDTCAAFFPLVRTLRTVLQASPNGPLDFKALLAQAGTLTQ